MKKLKQGIRLLALMLIIIMASVGLGMGGAIMPGHRGKFEDIPVKVELVEDKDEDDSETSEEEKS